MIFQRVNRYLSLVLLSTFIITFFTRNNFRSVTHIAPGVLEEPSQEESLVKEIIEFEKDGYKYQLFPLFDYEISGIVVGKMNYRLFGIDKTDSVFPVDIALIWGGNVKNGVYKDRRVKFSQDCRWCWVEWQGNVNFNFAEMSNNHTVVTDKGIEKRLKNLTRGDQIKIKGKLVNVKAHLLSKGGQFDPEWADWTTSVTRTDTGKGACEVVYVEEVRILKKANVLSFYLFRFSFYGLLGLIGCKIFWFFR